MSLAGTDFSFLKAATMGASASTSNIGGAPSATFIAGSATSEVFYAMTSSTVQQDQHEKTFLQNDHGSLTATGCACWLQNALDDVASNGVVSFQSDLASDSSSYYGRAIGADGSGVAQQEQVTLNGTSEQSGVLTFSRLDRSEKRSVATNALTAAVGSIANKVNGVLLGYIPAPDNENSYYSATAEVTIWLEASLGGTTTTTNPATAPAGSSFTKPRTQATALSFAGGGSLGPGQAQAIWWRLRLAANAKPSQDVDAAIKFAITTTG